MVSRLGLRPGWSQSQALRLKHQSLIFLDQKREKSHYHFQNLKQISKVTVSVSNFDTIIQKSWSQSQNAWNGLALH